MPRKFWPLIAVLAGFLLVFVILVWHNGWPPIMIIQHDIEADMGSPEFEALNDRAISGDIEAIRTLVNDAKEKKMPDIEWAWAFEGALWGDQALADEIVKKFHERSSPEAQKRLLKLVENELSKPGASRLRDRLRSRPANSTANSSR